MNIYSDEFVMKPVFAAYDKTYNPIDALIYLQLRAQYDSFNDFGTYDLETLSEDLNIDTQLIKESIQRLIAYKLINHLLDDGNKGIFILLMFHDGYPVPTEFLSSDLPTKTKAAFLAESEADTDEEFDRIAKYAPVIDELHFELSKFNYQIKVLSWRVENAKAFLREEIEKPDFDAEELLENFHGVTGILFTL